MTWVCLDAVAAAEPGEPAKEALALRLCCAVAGSGCAIARAQRTCAVRKSLKSWGRGVLLGVPARVSNVGAAVYIGGAVRSNVVCGGRSFAAYLAPLSGSGSGSTDGMAARRNDSGDAGAAADACFHALFLLDVSAMPANAQLQRRTFSCLPALQAARGGGSSGGEGEQPESVRRSCSRLAPA